jgi:hypothetical protein
MLCQAVHSAHTYFLEVHMANRGTPRGLFRYGVGALVLIIIAWIIYAVAGGTSTPGPDAVLDSTAAPKVQP